MSEKKFTYKTPRGEVTYTCRAFWSSTGEPIDFNNPEDARRLNDAYIRGKELRGMKLVQRGNKKTTKEAG